MTQNKRRKTGPDLNSFSGRVAHARVATGMTGAEAARKCGMTAASWHGLENKSASTRYLFEVADVLQVNPRWLATGQGPMKEEVSDFSLREVMYALIDLVQTLQGEARGAVVLAITACLSEQANPEEALASLEATLACARAAQEAQQEKGGNDDQGGGFRSVLPSQKASTTIQEDHLFEPLSGQKTPKRGPS